MSDEMKTNAEQVEAAANTAIAQIDDFEKQPPEEEIPEEEKIQMCPRCSYEMQKGTPVPTDSEIKEYVRCLIGGSLFTKEFPLFNSAIKIKFQLLTAKQSDLLSVALSSLPDVDFMQKAQEALQLKLLFYLREFGKEKFKCPDTSALQELEDEYAVRYNEKGEDVPVLHIRVMMQFLNLTEALPAAGLDEAFYKGAGLS
jgi:hypothetical protein